MKLAYFILIVAVFLVEDQYKKGGLFVFTNDKKQ